MVLPTSSSRFWKFRRPLFACAIVGAVQAFGQLPVAPVSPGSPASAPERETRAQKVELLRDGSVEESLARKIDVGFGSVRIDGEKSSVPLSSLTADQVLAAETTKVPTPDLDADAVGGLLQLTSRRAFDQKKPTLRASVGAGFDAMTGKLNPEGSVTFGRAFGRGARFGFVVTASGSRESNHGEEVDIDWDSSVGGGILQEVSLSEDDSIATESAFNGLLDWKLGEKSAAQFRVNYSTEKENQTERSIAYRLDDRRQPATSTSEIERVFSEESERETIFTVAGGLAHKAERWELEAKASFTRTLNETPDERSYEFRQQGVGIDYAVLDPRFPRIMPRTGTRPDDAGLFLLDEFQRGRGEQIEDDAVASLDLKLPALGGWKTAWAKVGTKFRALRTDHFEANDVSGATGSGVRLSEVAEDARNDDFMDGRYAWHTFPDGRRLRELFAAQPGRLALDVDATRGDTDPANYEVQQDVSAHYAMASAALGRRTRLLGGVRMERTANTFTGREVIFDANGRYETTNRVGATGEYTNWFPGLHLTHALLPRLDLFASWTKSIRRPEYDQLVPSRQVNRSSLELEEGNPALRPTLYTNIDLALEFAYHRSGRLAFEAFHRDITDTLLERRTILSGGIFDGYERRRPENGGGASQRGFELKWKQELAVVGEILKGSAVEANYTYVDSKQEIANRAGERISLTDLPTHELILQLAYERSGFFGSVEMNHVSRRLESVAGRRADDRFQPARTQWDVSLSYTLNDRWRFFADVENLLEAPDRSYEGEPGRVEDYSLEPRTFRIGVKWEM